MRKERKKKKPKFLAREGIGVFSVSFQLYNVVVVILMVCRAYYNYRLFCAFGKKGFAMIFK